MDIDSNVEKLASAVQTPSHLQIKSDGISRTDAVKQTVPFTSMPREIRDHIYSFVQPIGVNVADDRQQFGNHPLSTVCKQVSLEWRDYYHSNTTFILDIRSEFDFRRAKNSKEKHKATKPLREWLENMSEREAGRLRTLTLYGWNDIVRIEISVRPLTVTVTCEPNRDQKVDEKWTDGVARLQKLIDTFRTIVNKGDHLGGAAIIQLCEFAMLARDVYHYPRGRLGY
ncbi:hypothetical protein LTR10_011196 [Elasticomyces elasticus]|nr:hypothetical protein LTR10_011196 [Elasticomyces elasticus]KAK4966383.1 hypothetical protein LTR42_011546 [Elasticomyces elasticus]